MAKNKRGLFVLGAAVGAVAGAVAAGLAILKKKDIPVGQVFKKSFGDQEKEQPKQPDGRWEEATSKERLEEEIKEVLSKPEANEELPVEETPPEDNEKIVNEVLEKEKLENEVIDALLEEDERN